MNFVRDNPGEPVPEETFTHSHLSWSSVAPYLLHPSNMIQKTYLLHPFNTIHGILPVQFFPQSQVLFGLPFGLAPSTSYSIHFFTQSLSSFRNTCPYHRSLFCTVVPRLCHLILVSHSTLFLEFYLVASRNTSI